MNIFIVMFLLLSNSDGLGDPKSLYPSEFILAIPPPRMSTGISPKFRSSFWQLSLNTTKAPEGGLAATLRGKKVRSFYLLGLSIWNATAM